MFSSTTPYTAGPTFIKQLIDRLTSYISTKNFANNTSLDFLDQPQAPNYNGLTAVPTNLAGKTISSSDFINSIDPTNYQSLNFWNTTKTASTSYLTTFTSTTTATPMAAASELLNTINQLSNAYISKTLSTISQLSTTTTESIALAPITIPTTITNVPYPRFSAGTPVYPILI